MTLADLYKVIAIGEKVVIRDYNKNSKEIYTGSIDNMPLDYFEKNVRWVSVSHGQNKAITIIVE